MQLLGKRKGERNRKGKRKRQKEREKRESWSFPKGENNGERE